MQEKLDQFHRLVMDGHYREARGILESEPDIPPQVAEKWLLWLDELHHDEWMQAGVVSDAKKRDPQRALDDLGAMIGGMTAVIPTAVGLWLLVTHVLTYSTSNVATGAFFVFAALVAGYLGWQRAAAWINPGQSVIIGAGITLVLMVLLVSSGIPAWYYFDPPLIYRLAAFGLFAPAAAYLSYATGTWLGRRITRLFNHEAVSY